MMDGTKGGAQRANSLRPRCVGEVDPETATHIYVIRHASNILGLGLQAPKWIDAPILNWLNGKDN
jgi:hypothetical protein